MSRQCFAFTTSSLKSVQLNVWLQCFVAPSGDLPGERVSKGVQTDSVPTSCAHVCTEQR